MYANTRLWFVAGALALTTAGACTLQKNDDAEAFRDVVPQSTAVALAGPDSARGSTSTAAEAPSLRPLDTAPVSYAKWYGFTREMRDGVNQITAGVLGSIWVIIRAEPSASTVDSATWGPWTDALTPASYRFRVTRTALDEYDYVLEGRAKTSNADADYRAVLTGRGFGSSSARHGQGSFEIDLDAAKALDPFHNQDNSGTVSVVHDLPRGFSSEPVALPRTITATVKPQGDVHYSVESTANSDFTGHIHVNAHVDIDDSKQTALEDVVIDSHWNATGAGRADIEIAGGDLPASVAMVDVVECWATDFTQSYYTDSVSLAPTAGEAGACVYAGK